MKEALTKALVGSVKDAFKAMFSIDLVDGDMPHDHVVDAELICTIGLAGKMEGSVSVALPERSACVIVSKMLCTEMTEISPDVCDGMGEIANVVAGGIKMRTVQLNCPFQVSIPTVVQGKRMHLNVADGLEKIIRHFEGDGFSFDVEFVYKIAAVVGPDEPKAAEASSKMSAFEKLKAMTAKAGSSV